MTIHAHTPLLVSVLVDGHTYGARRCGDRWLRDDGLDVSPDVRREIDRELRRALEPPG